MSTSSARSRSASFPAGTARSARCPSWAPDGRRIVLVGVQYGDPYRLGGLYIGVPGARSNRALTTEGGPLYDDRAPAWSPNGSLIAFARNRTGASTLLLYVIRPNGRGLRQLTTTFADNPTWSPDSRQLAFDDGDRIAAIGIDGRGFRYLTRGPRDTNPAWSPDGKTIAFIRNGNLWEIDASGRNARRIARGASEPAWSLP
jgi:TolB protein